MEKERNIFSCMTRVIYDSKATLYCMQLCKEFFLNKSYHFYIIVFLIWTRMTLVVRFDSAQFRQSIPLHMLVERNTEPQALLTLFEVALSEVAVADCPLLAIYQCRVSTTPICTVFLPQNTCYSYISQFFFPVAC